ncbi:MAG TPA: CoA transferase [Burkholderiaceae bacterium]|nr:CoA transferase [Burkholderiaceae bacterium]
MKPAVSQGPLGGVRVLDWTHVLAGPFAGYLLGQMGADVIRFERIDQPEMIRNNSLDPLLGPLGLGEGFVMQGSGKRSIGGDIRDPEVKAAIHALLATVDVLVENFRPGKLAALGFGPAELIERHSRLIVCSITGFGQTGPQAGRRAYDHVIQARTGYMAANADADDVPTRVGMPLIDYGTGMQAALAVTAALHRRAADELRGVPRPRGEWLDVAMVDAALSLAAPTFAQYAVSGRERVRAKGAAFSGSPLSGTFRTREGYVALTSNSPVQTAALFAALLQAGASAARLDTLKAAATAMDVTAAQRVLAEILAERTAAEWETLLEAAQVPCAAVRTPAQAWQESLDADTATPPKWPSVTMSSADGRTIRVPGAGFTSTLPVRGELRPPPRVGEHTADILAEAGVEPATIERLVREGKLRAV